MPKRNSESIKTAHLKAVAGRSQSQYGKKLATGKMMYGPGCCANKTTDSQVAAARRRAVAEGHRIASWAGETV